MATNWNVRIASLVLALVGSASSATLAQENFQITLTGQDPGAFNIKANIQGQSQTVPMMPASAPLSGDVRRGITDPPPQSSAPQDPGPPPQQFQKPNLKAPDLGEGQTPNDKPEQTAQQNGGGNGGGGNSNPPQPQTPPPQRAQLPQMPSRPSSGSGSSPSSPSMPSSGGSSGSSGPFRAGMGGIGHTQAENLNKLYNALDPRYRSAFANYAMNELYRGNNPPPSGGQPGTMLSRAMQELGQQLTRAGTSQSSTEPPRRRNEEEQPRRQAVKPPDEEQQPPRRPVEQPPEQQPPEEQRQPSRVVVQEPDKPDEKPVEPSHVAAVQQAMTDIPENVQRAMEKEGYKVVAADTITGFNENLKGQVPRGWDNGQTWENVDGAANITEGNKEVLIAQRYLDESGYQDTQRVGDLVRHEYGHAVDQMLGRGNGDFSQTPEFIQAYEDDKKEIEANGTPIKDYFLQSGDAGRSEVFGEVFSAKHSSNPDEQDTRMTNAFHRVRDLIQQQEDGL